MAEKIATRDAYGNALAELGEKYNFVVLDADLAAATKTGIFKKKFPERFFDCGIAEGNMMSVAAGLAATGVPVFASSFAMFAAGDLSCPIEEGHDLSAGAVLINTERAFLRSGRIPRGNLILVTPENGFIEGILCQLLCQMGILFTKLQAITIYLFVITFVYQVDILF